MNNTQIKHFKYKASNWTIVFFASTLVIGILTSIFFQAPTKSNHALSRFQTLISYSHIMSASGLQFSNRLGDFSLEKIRDNEWMLTKPRTLPAKIETVNLIFNELKNLKIREVLTKDLINISNYSLESPLLKIKLSSEINNERQDFMRISFGLINPIDNSTYVMLENNEAIYHTGAISNSLQTLALSDFVDSKIFPVPKNDVARFEIYKGNPLRSDLKLSIYKDNNEYKSKRGTGLREKRVLKYFNDIHNIKSYFLIDKKSPKLEKQISRLVNNPLYTVLVTSTKGKEYTFKISGTISSLDGIKMEKRKNFLIWASHRKHPYLVEKNSLKLFYKTKKSFKKRSIKKLFY